MFFKFLLLPIFALALCVTSCGDDDLEQNQPENPSENPSGSSSAYKKLKSIVFETKNREGEITEFESYSYKYNDEGLPVSVESYFYNKYGTHTDTYTYDWDNDWNDYYGNDGVMVCLNGSPENYYSIVDGKVVKAVYAEDISSNSDYYHFTYDSNGFLKNVVDISNGKEFSTEEYNWVNGKLMQRKADVDYIRDISLIYLSETCKGFSPSIAGYAYDDELLFRATPWLVGCVQQDLPVKEISGSHSSDFSYTFYDDGYLKSCVMVDEYGEIVDSFVWE